MFENQNEYMREVCRNRKRRYTSPVLATNKKFFYNYAMDIARRLFGVGVKSKRTGKIVRKGYTRRRLYLPKRVSKNWHRENREMTLHIHVYYYYDNIFDWEVHKLNVPYRGKYLFLTRQFNKIRHLVKRYFQACFPNKKIISVVLRDIAVGNKTRTKSSFTKAINQAIYRKKCFTKVSYAREQLGKMA